LREVLRTIDLDSNKRVAVIEYCLYKFKDAVKDLLSVHLGCTRKCPTQS